MLYVRLLALCLSIRGYVLFLKKRYRIDLAFASAITVLFIIAVVFLGGILGILQWAAYLLLILGLALLIWMLLDKTPTGWKSILTNPALIFLTVSGIYLFLRFQNRVLYDYDDFSHWGLIVKSMLTNNSFPASANSLLTFQSYPPGSACWIYFVARAVGNVEGVYLFAQAMLTLSCLASLFGYFGKRRWYDLVIPVAGAVLVYTNALDPNCLGVDVLLAAAGLASVLTIYRYRNRLTSHFLLILPMVFSTILIKNSGIFFSLLSMVLCIYYILEQKSAARRKKVTAALVMAVVPIVVLLLWRWHVSAAFENGLATKHAMSLTNFLSMWQVNKSYAADMLKVILLLMINPLKNGTIIVLGGFILLAGLEALIRRDPKANQRNVLLILVLVLCSFLYEIGVAGMYLFSMSPGEFFYQNGGDYIRYNSTLVSFLCGILIAFCGRKFAGKDAPRSKRFDWILRLGTLAIMLACLLPYNTIGRLTPTYRTDLEIRIEQLKLALEETPLPSGGSYYVKTPEDEGDFPYYLFRYQLDSDDVTISSDAIDYSEIGEVVSIYTAYINWVNLRVYTEANYEG